MSIHQDFIEKELGELTSKLIGILKFELKNHNLFSKSKSDHSKIIPLLKTDKQKEKYFQLAGKDLINEKVNKEERKIQSRSNHIYMLALFERYRISLLKHSFKSSDKHKKAYRQSFTNIVQRIPDEKKKLDLLSDAARNPENLIDQIDKIHGQQFEIERNMFGLRELKGKNLIQDSLCNYIISREIRHLLIHRSNRSDKKLFSGIKNGLGGTKYRNDDEGLSKLLDNRFYFNLSKFEVDKEVIISTRTIIRLFFDIFYLSYVMTSNAFPKKISKTIGDSLGSSINDIICLALSNNLNLHDRKFIYLLLNYYVDDLLNSSINKIDLNSDMMLVNHVILQKHSKNFIYSSVEIFKQKDLKKNLSRKRSEISLIDSTISQSIKNIDDKKIKKIILCYVKDDDASLIAAIEDFKQPHTDLSNWSLIIEKSRSSHLINDYLKYELAQKNIEFFKTIIDETSEN